MTPASRMSSPPNGRATAQRPTHRQQSAMMPEQLANCVEDWPLTSLCAAFGGGLIAGVGLVALYCQMQPSHTTAESLMQRVSDTVRNSLSQHLASFRS